MQRVLTPSHPYRLGTRRRRSAGREAGSRPTGVSQPGASRTRGARPSSLDTDKQLATSDREWLASTITEADRYRQQLSLHRELTNTYLTIYQKYATLAADDPEQRQWWADYQAETRRREDEESADQWKRIAKWIKAHKPTGPNAEAVRWEKKWARLQHCQQEWIGYRAECCGDKTRAIAVPIGCNDRQCPLCAWHRSQRARVKVKQLYDRLTHPVLITLTIPNLPAIRKKHIHHFRKMIRAWLKQQGRLTGGIYSIECTFNRQDRTWHLHAHVLANMTTQLPTTAEGKVDFFGERVFPFVKAKWEWEFDWLNLSRDAWAKMPKPEQVAKGRKRWADAWADYRIAFERWTKAKREHSTRWAKTWNPRTHKLQPRTDLSEQERRRFREMERWNARNTRLLDIRPVTDRDGAVFEVLKYLTKGAQFSDIPEAVEMFALATAGARMVQTFGSFYGFDVETKFDPEHLDDWGEHKCSCGQNQWIRVGVIFRRDVEMDQTGRWFLKRPIQQHGRGTVPRPTIRALDAPIEGKAENPWQMQRIS